MKYYKSCINLILLIVLLFPMFLWAQVPGYLGKRATVNLSLSTSLAIFGPTQNNRGSDDYNFGQGPGGIGINYDFGLDFSYVVSRYAEISIAVGQYYTGATSNAVTVPFGLELLPTSNEPQFDEHYLFHRVNVRSLSVIYSKFKPERGAIAPFGNRFYFGLKRNFVNASIIDKRTDFYSSNFGEIFGHQNIGIESNVAFHYALFGWANNRILWDKVVFTTGLRIAIPLELGNFSSNTFTEDARNHPDYEMNPNQIDYEMNIWTRLALHESFRFNISIGYLLF